MSFFFKNGEQEGKQVLSGGLAPLEQAAAVGREENRRKKYRRVNMVKYYVVMYIMEK
jgi:hypothetical protein